MINFLLLPQTWILLAVLGVSSLIFRVKPSPAALTAVILYVVSFLLANMWQLAPHRDYAVKLYQLGAFIYIVLLLASLVYVVFKPRVLQDGDLLAQLVWVILLVAEVGQVIEYLECKILLDPYSVEELRAMWGVEISIYACGRAWGPWGPFIFEIITLTALAWILIAALRAKRSVPNVRELIRGSCYSLVVHICRLYRCARRYTSEKISSSRRDHKRNGPNSSAGFSTGRDPHGGSHRKSGGNRTPPPHS